MFKKFQFQAIITLFIFLFSCVFLYSINALTKSNIDIELPNFYNLTSFINSNKYTQIDDEEIALNHQTINPSSTPILTEIGTVYLDEEALSFQIVNNNGYIWSSTINYENSDLSPNWKKRVRSGIHIESYNTNNANYAVMEEFVLSDGTQSTTTIIANGFESRITFGRSRISILLKVEFTKTGIIVAIPNSEIIEDGPYKLAAIKVYPFFGAFLEDKTPGYVFIPDGIGALVRYSKSKPGIIANYQKEIYGRNLSYNIETNLNRFVNDGTRIYAPVFGFVHGINQNAVFANILSGDEYGLINLYYAGKTTNYTTVFSEFVYRKTYKQPIDKAGNTISLLQNNPNKFDIKILYNLLEGEDANYIGMAKTYQKYLEDSHGLILNKKSDLNIPLQLATIGLEKKKGPLADQTVIMTTFNDYSQIINRLNQQGIDNIVATYKGFTGGGASWSAPKYEKISRKLGSSKDLEELINKVSEFYFVTNFVMGSSKSGGFSQYSDLAKKINDQYYQYQGLTDSKYFLEHHKTGELFQKSQNKLSKYNLNGLAIESMGNALYNDLSNDINLAEAVTLYYDLLKDSSMAIGLYDANSYLWSVITSYFDFPMYSSQYIPFSDTVPFLAIALHGKLPIFASNANFYANARDELLRLIDFGVYPSFVVTQESSKKLQNTELEYIYTSRFADIENSIITYYQFVNDALKYVMNAKVDNRKVIEAGLSVINYDNDYSIIVNYHHQPKNYQGHFITSKNYIVIDKDNAIVSGGWDHE